MQVDDAIIRMLEQTQRSLVASAGEARASGVETSVHDVLASSIPHIPGLIERYVPEAHAVILTKDNVRNLLAEFATSLAFVQAGVLKNLDGPKRRKKTNRV